ncbi:MAG: hypothetical protein H6863_01360 [Rhodospirillales bacterium]|nr:hypothetical protein [Rhodospirillales bacterium]
MVQSVTNFSQQAVASPFTKKGDSQQQQQTTQKRTPSETAAATGNRETIPSRRTTGPEQTRSSATQGTQQSAQFNRNPTELSVSEFRSQFGIEENQTPPRGSLVDISA